MKVTSSLSNYFPRFLMASKKLFMHLCQYLVTAECLKHEACVSNRTTSTSRRCHLLLPPHIPTRGGGFSWLVHPHSRYHCNGNLPSLPFNHHETMFSIRHFYKLDSLSGSKQYQCKIHDNNCIFQQHSLL